MCGIIGQVAFKGVPSTLPTLSLLNHRGPDGSDEWINPKGTVYLGHTRLAILEPTAAGKQPMTNEAKRFTITFNGEIYNHIELRHLLPHIHWRGNSDTETLVELLAAKGLPALRLLKGMFAFGLYDSKEKSILLVRDRLGIKPLWYKQNENSLRFSSEIRALLELGKISLTDHALSEYIGFGRMPESGEIIEHVQAVAPGGWLKITENGSIDQGSWWPDSGSFQQQATSRKDSVHLVKKLLSTAIEEHLISDVGMGAFLSGGIDSSIVTLVAGQLLGRKLQTFTIGFPQKTFDERSIAKKVAVKAGSAHTELEVTSETCLNWVQEAVDKLDLPSVDAINTYIVSKAVRDTGLKVALSGLGGDELFGGYPSFRSVPWLHLLDSLPLWLSQQLVTTLPGSIKQKIGGLTDFTPLSLTSARRRFTSVNSLKTMGYASGTPMLPPAPCDLDIMGKISWTEIYSYMLPMLLRDSDQMSMAVGLEIRVPFLDHCLVEAVLSLPKKYKTGPGIKPLLVEAFRSELPPEVYNRPKQGFSLPMDEWLRGPLAPFLREGVFVTADLLALTQPLRLLESFEKGAIHWTRIWSWCVLGHWLAKQNKVAKAEEPR